jgi:hypothetical protein
MKIKYLNEMHWTVFVYDRSRFMKLQFKRQRFELLSRTVTQQGLQIPISD